MLSVPSFHEAAVLRLAALCTLMSLICLMSDISLHQLIRDGVSYVSSDSILASDWSLAQNTGL